MLRDLELGETRAASEAMDPPPDLAVALLKDSDGVVDLELTVKGKIW